MATQFTTPAHLEMMDEYRWMLLTPFVYHVGSYPSDDVILVPTGFVTDLASIPRIFWTILPPNGEYSKAAIVHDYLYDNAINTKEYADNVFLEAMTVLGVCFWRRYLIYWAVRLFGRGQYDKQRKV